MAEHFYRLRAISATLACEEANSKLVDVVTVADDEVQARFQAGVWSVSFC